MSREVIRDIIIPIITKILQEERYLTPYRTFEVRDEVLEEFLEEELRRRFGVIGANRCQHLREQLEEARRNDPYEFEFTLRQLLRKYVQLQIKLRQAQKERDNLQGPPDRFSDQRRRYETKLLRRQHEDQSS